MDGAVEPPLTANDAEPRRRIAGAASLNVLHLFAQSIDLDFQT